MRTSETSPTFDLTGLPIEPVTRKSWVDKDTPFRQAIFSDIHLGHNRVRTEFILENLAKFWHNPDFLKTVDMIVIAGDLFDRLVYMNQTFVPIIDIFFIATFKFAKQYDVDFILLEGTPSHDRAQGKRLIALNTEIGNVHANVTYIDTLSIYYDTRRDKHYLFVPDEWHHDPKETFKQVEDLLRARKLDKVDFSYMHGNFTYQLPAIAKAPTHDEDSYLRITRYAIYIGHIHVRSKYERIYAQGSFDRISHGEESPKGFYYGVLKGETYTSTFIKNVDAKTFITLDCREMDVDTAMRFIDTKVSDLREDSHVMLYVYEDSALNKASYLAAIYPEYNWKIKTERSLKTGTIESLERDLDYTPIYITPETITDLVRDDLHANGTDNDTLAIAVKELQSIIEELTNET